MAFTTWHSEIDTLPRLRRRAGDPATADLILPVGVWSDSPEPYRVTVDVAAARAPWLRIGGNASNATGVVTPVTADRIAEIRRTEGAGAVRPYLEMERRIRDSGNLYWEAVLPGLPLDTEIGYRIAVRPPAGTATWLGPYTLHLTDPSFGFDDVVAMAAHDEIDRSWILYHRHADGFHHLRLDLTDVSTARPDVTIAFPGGPSYALARPWTLPAMPIIDPFADTIRLSVPDAGLPDARRVEINGEPVDLTAPPRRAKARMMFVHYCIQGLNDLFELPNKEYTPYRTYMQTTMRDEKGTYSSRPNSAEHGEEDGYALTLDAHREFGIPHLWTFNGGVLSLIAQDCPEDLARIREDIAAGLLSPTIAGFGGHRLPYYQDETNRYAIGLGADMMRAVLGTANPVYYLDQRLYKQDPNVMRPLMEADAIRYIVLDGSTAFAPYRSTAKPGAGAEGRFLDHAYLWQDQVSGLYVLFIDDDLREQMVGNSHEEQVRGELALSLRRKLMYFATRSTGGGIRAGHLLVYSDDADKASGNGWFDGDYSGSEIEYNDKFRASLEWIAAHPWIEAVTDN
ncbi:MAG: hypothetical protein GEV11_13885, partial [Streptosporangiales bacterium]|nr:hypothetical protein [Streptosporangiales bacterium]